MSKKVYLRDFMSRESKGALFVVIALNFIGPFLYIIFPDLASNLLLLPIAVIFSFFYGYFSDIEVPPPEYVKKAKSTFFYTHIVDRAGKKYTLYFWWAAFGLHDYKKTLKEIQNKKERKKNPNYEQSTSRKFTQDKTNAYIYVSSKVSIFGAGSALGCVIASFFIWPSFAPYSNFLLVGLGIEILYTVYILNPGLVPSTERKKPLKELLINNSFIKYFLVGGFSFYFVAVGIPSYAIHSNAQKHQNILKKKPKAAAVTDLKITYGFYYAYGIFKSPLLPYYKSHFANQCQQGNIDYCRIRGLFSIIEKDFETAEKFLKHSCQADNPQACMDYLVNFDLNSKERKNYESQIIKHCQSSKKLCLAYAKSSYPKNLKQLTQKISTISARKTANFK